MDGRQVLSVKYKSIRKQYVDSTNTGTSRNSLWSLARENPTLQKRASDESVGVRRVPVLLESNLVMSSNDVTPLFE